MPPPVIAAIIAGGATVGGAAIGAHGNTEAAKTQAASDAAALAQAKQIYEQQRADQGPYRESGYGALSALNYGLGLPDVGGPKAPTPSYAQGPPPTGQPFSPASLSQLHTVAQHAQGGLGGGALNKLEGKMTQVANTTVKVLAPDGRTFTIPIARLPEAIAAGGQKVS